MNTQNTLKPGPKLELVVKDLQNFALFKLDGSEKSQAQKLVLLQAACFVLSEKVSLGDFFRQFKRGEVWRFLQYREKRDFRWNWYLTKDEAIQLVRILSESIAEEVECGD